MSPDHDPTDTDIPSGSKLRRFRPPVRRPRQPAADGVHDSHDLALPARTRQTLAVIAIGLGLATAVGMLALRAREKPSEKLRATGLVTTFYDGRIQALDPERPCPGFEEGSERSAEPFLGSEADLGESPAVCPRAVVVLLGGPDKESSIFVDLPSHLAGKSFAKGDKIVLSYTPDAEQEFQYVFADRQRKPVLFWLAAAFALVVILLGRLRGLAALLGLIASGIVLLAFVLPAILDGRSPVLVAVVGASAIAFLALYLAHGPRPATTVALLGTLLSLALTAVLAALVTRIAALSGFASEEASLVQLADVRIDLVGLVLAGVVIGALGAIDDMTVTQVAAVNELHAANPELGPRRLYRAALRIGRDHVASTVNTLALAYAGASLPLLLLFLLSRQSLGAVANGEVVATEVIRTLVGSIGLVCSVPITTWLAVRVLASGASGADRTG